MGTKKEKINKKDGLSRRQALKAIGAAAITSAMMPFPFVHASKKPTLRFLNQESDPGTLKFFKEAFAEWEDKTGVKVLLDTVTHGSTRDKLISSVKAGNPYHIGNANGMPAVLDMAEEGWLVPLTDIIKKIGIDDFGPNCLFPVDGEIWAYPYDYNFCFWFYRKDLYAEKDLSKPQTWAQFLKNAKVLTYDKNNDGVTDMYGACMAIGSAPQGIVDWVGTAFMWADGVEFFDDKWKVIFDSPQMKPKVVAYLNFYKELYPYLVPGAANMKYGDLIKNFITNRAAMSPYTGRMVHHIDTKAPELSDKFGIFSYPSSDGSNSAVTNAQDYWFVTKTEYTEEATKLLKWLMTDKLIDFLATLPLHYQPTQLSIYDNPRWKSLPMVKKYPDIVKELKSFITRKDMIITGVEQQGPEFNKKVSKITSDRILPQMYQNLILKKLAPEECVEIAANGMRKVMA